MPRPPQPGARPQQAAPPVRAGRGVVGPPRQLAANTSISISKVDMSRPCNMCQVVMPNPTALVEHMNRNHFRGLQGLNIIQGGASPAPGAPPGKAARLQGVSLSKPGGGGGLPVEGFGRQVEEAAPTKESSIRKEVEGL